MAQKMLLSLLRSSLPLWFCLLPLLRQQPSFTLQQLQLDQMLSHGYNDSFLVRNQPRFCLSTSTFHF